MLSHVIGKCALALGAITLAAGLTMAVPDTAEAAKQCKGYYTAKGKDYSKKQARYEAIYNWERYIANYYGKYWAKWSYASYKSTWCDYEYGYWLCWAKARPCYYGGGGGGGGGY